MSEPAAECANPLFLQWVTEWYEEARKRNAKTQYTLKKACTSLERYPLRIEHAQDAVQLQGIGQGIAERLGKKLASWRKAQGIAEPVRAASAEPRATSSGEPAAGGRARAPRAYVPRYRSGAFALLLGLFKTYCLYGADYFVPKSELVPLCEPYTDTPFHVSSGAAQQSAWLGMKTLETKALAERQGGVKFSLTDEGVEIAQKVVEVLRARNELSDEDGRMFAAFAERTAASEDARSPSSDYDGFADGAGPAASARPRTARPVAASRSSSAVSFSRQSSAAGQVELADLTRYPAGSYDVILAVDSREVHNTGDRALIEQELEKQGVRLEIRPLVVGDYLWIARPRAAAEHRRLPDVVLDVVVERKRMDDLCASIRDGRYREQHARIHAAGFATVFYVVEGSDPDAVARLGEAAVSSALSRVQIANGFHLKQPPTFEATLRLLRQTTELLQSTLGDLYAIPDRHVGHHGLGGLKRSVRARHPQAHLAISVDAYDVVCGKSTTLSVGEVYLRMLMAVRGVSADKALAVGSRFPTPLALVRAFEADGGVGRIGDIAVDGTSRKIGPALARRLEQFWTADSF
ncbi:Crossover junction endonuclease mus81 [Coemansia sp. RSA 2705]|nr:Crossover junction endonuclease mus81 [Coemansia sp. RSA 2705]